MTLKYTIIIKSNTMTLAYMKFSIMVVTMMIMKVIKIIIIIIKIKSKNVCTLNKGTLVI